MIIVYGDKMHAIIGQHRDRRIASLKEKLLGIIPGLVNGSRNLSEKNSMCR